MILPLSWSLKSEDVGRAMLPRELQRRTLACFCQLPVALCTLNLGLHHSSSCLPGPGAISSRLPVLSSFCVCLCPLCPYFPSYKDIGHVGPPHWPHCKFIALAKIPDKHQGLGNCSFIEKENTTSKFYFPFLHPLCLLLCITHPASLCHTSQGTIL